MFRNFDSQQLNEIKEAFSVLSNYGINGQVESVISLKKNKKIINTFLFMPFLKAFEH